MRRGECEVSACDKRRFWVLGSLLWVFESWASSVVSEWCVLCCIDQEVCSKSWRSGGWLMQDCLKYNKEFSQCGTEWLQLDLARSWTKTSLLVHEYGGWKLVKEFPPVRWSLAFSRRFSWSFVSRSGGMSRRFLGYSRRRDEYCVVQVFASVWGLANCRKSDWSIILGSDGPLRLFCILEDGR